MTWAFCSLGALLASGQAADAMPGAAVAAWAERPRARWATLHFLGNRQMGVSAGVSGGRPRRSVTALSALTALRGLASGSYQITCIKT